MTRRPSPSRHPSAWLEALVHAGTRTPVAGATISLEDTPLSIGPLATGSDRFPALRTTSGANGGPAYAVSIIAPPTSRAARCFRAGK